MASVLICAVACSNPVSNSGGNAGSEAGVRTAEEELRGDAPPQELALRIQLYPQVLVHQDKDLRFLKGFPQKLITPGLQDQRPFFLKGARRNCNDGLKPTPAPPRRCPEPVEGKGIPPLAPFDRLRTSPPRRGIKPFRSSSVSLLE